MYDNGQWAGNSQKEMADSLQVLVEMTPQLPIDKVVYQVRSLRKKLLKYLVYQAEKRKGLPTIITDEQRELTCEL